MLSLFDESSGFGISARENAESAESALDYLNAHRPDVIFMDHLMPGMDGFEAVTAIKNNPETATIPIMMYTSQKGEVYVGQARALGAVGVLPKQVEPVEVSKVLESLRVIGDEAERRAGRDESDAIESSGDYPALERLDQNLRELIQDLFDQQRANSDGAVRGRRKSTPCRSRRQANRRCDATEIWRDLQNSARVWRCVLQRCLQRYRR